MTDNTAAGGVTPRVRRILMALLSCAALTAVVACGSEDSEGEAPAEEAPAQQEEAAEGDEQAAAEATPSGAEDPAPASQAAAPTGGEAPAPAAEGDAAAGDNAAVEANCRALIAGMWEAAQERLALLGQTTDDDDAARYLRDADRFVSRCAATETEEGQAPARTGLSDEQIACIAAAEDTLQGFATCDVNRGRSASTRVRPPSLSRYVDLPPTPEVSEEEGASRVRALAGTWTATGFGSVHTWAISRDGAVHETRVRESGGEAGETEEQDFTLSIDRDHRISMRRPDNSGQTYVFLSSGDHFYTSSNLVYDVFPVPSRDRFIVQAESDYVLVGAEGLPACYIISSVGIVGEGTRCEFTQDEGRDVFMVEYTLPGEYGFRDRPAERSRRFLALDGYVVDDRALEWSRQ